MIRCEKGSAQPGASLTTVTDAVSILQPKAVVCIGCCGLVNLEKAKLGDVVISTKLATYAEKKIAEDGTVKWLGSKVHVSRNMANLIPAAADGWEPPLEEPHTFHVEVHRDALMLSGPERVDNAERRKQLLRHHPDAIAVEMEGEGTVWGERRGGF